MCSKLDILVNDYGFSYMTNVQFSNGRLFFPNIKRGQFSNIVYAIVIDNNLVYIGKTKDFYKRIDTYKNCKHWKGAYSSNIEKTNTLEKAISKGKLIEIYFRRYILLENSKINGMDYEEERFIQLLQPSWNSHFCNEKGCLWIP